MDKVSGLSRDCLHTLNQLRALDGHEPVSPQLLHRRVGDAITRMLNEARSLGVPEKDAQDMAYALVALADEIAISKTGPIHHYWRDNLLQMQFFDENVAGEGFFRRLQSLRQDHRRSSVLRVYYLCLLFGFQGIHVGRGEGELRRLTEAVGEELARTLDVPDELAPDGRRPDEAQLKRREKRPLLWAGVASIALALSGYIGLRVVLDGQTDDAVDEMKELRPAPAAEPARRWGRP
ncbi:MAG TPA: DotU/TssL family secretion system protein [Polyangia bacterium]